MITTLNLNFIKKLMMIYLNLYIRMDEDDEEYMKFIQPLVILS